MFSKKETSLMRQQFWTAFGQYMAPIKSAEGEKINWINYKTGVKHIDFRMNAEDKKAIIAIELTHKDADIQQLIFDQFYELKNIFHSATCEEWIWQLYVKDENEKLFSRIYTEENVVSVFKKEDWPQLISFFKPRIIALDEFWSNVKYGFEEQIQ